MLPTPSVPSDAILLRSVTTDRLRERHSALNQPAQDTLTNVLNSTIRYNGDYLTFQSDYVTTG